MSLINEALKKAQRQRGDQPSAGDAAGGPIEKRGAPMRAQSLLIMVAGAAVLIVFSVIVTVYLVNRRPPQLASSTPPAPKQVIRSDPTDLSPIVIAPIVQPATAIPTPGTRAAEVTAKPVEAPGERKSEAAPLPAPSRAPATPAEVPARIAGTATPVATPVAENPAPATPKALPPASNAPADPRALAFVDAIRVTGIRSSGNESKVLMNDRVFRVNDVVDRSLNLKLVKVESDTLTFTDPNGVIYTKNF